MSEHSQRMCALFFALRHGHVCTEFFEGMEHPPVPDQGKIDIDLYRSYPLLLLKDCFGYLCGKLRFAAAYGIDEVDALYETRKQTLALALASLFSFVACLRAPRT